MNAMKSWWLTGAMTAALLITWAGERVVEGGTQRTVTSTIGVALILATVLLRGVRWASTKAFDARRVEGLMLWVQGLGAFAVALYFWQSDVYAKLSGSMLEAEWPKFGGTISALWPGLLLMSLLMALWVELSYAAMARAPTLELGRIHEARNAGAGMAFVIITAVALQYVASERDVKKDFSYFRVARPGDATKKLVQSLDEKVQVTLFYPPASDAAELVENYFDELKDGAPMLAVTRLDYALEPVKAKELGVTGNGTVLVQKGARKESLYIGVEVEKSRTQLRSLDAEVQKRLLQVAKARRVVYFTGGHGERTQDPLGGADQRANIDALHRTLQDLNFDVRVLTQAEGLGVDVPKDAAAVFVIGPQKPFSQAEAQTLVEYGKRGGKLFFALDPEAGESFSELLEPLGLQFKAEVLANDQTYARISRTYSPSDRRNIGTRSFSSHPAVTYLSRYQAQVLFLGAGAVDELPKHPTDLNLDFAIRALPSTWNDVNNNFQFDSPPEVRKSYGLLAAVSRRSSSNKIEEELRALVLGDSDALTDDILRAVQGNQLIVVDGFKWLLGEETLQGATSSELDVPMARTREQDNFWFYGTTVLAPIAMLGVGFFARRRPVRRGATS